MKPFEQLVTDHGATVLRICRVVLGPGPDSEDAWSETFLAALKAYPQLAHDANHEAWLVTIAHRKAIDVVRKRERTAVPAGDIPEAASAHGNPGDYDDELWAAVKSLPARQREAVAYHYLAGFPHRDVAEMTGSTPDAVRRAAADGIAKLRRSYGAIEGVARPPGNDGAAARPPANDTAALPRANDAAARPQPAARRPFFESPPLAPGPKRLTSVPEGDTP